MGTKQNKNITYKNCEDLPIHNFDKIKTEGNFMWLVRGYDGYNEVEIPENAEDLFGEIINEYCELTGDNRTAQYYELVVEVARLETRYLTAHALLETLFTPTEKEVRKEIIKELGHWGFYLNVSKDFKKEIERLKRQLRSAKTKIERKRNDLNDFESDDEPTDILDQKLSLERILEKDRIDLKLTPVKEWVKMTNTHKR